jgi:hypothetical protein
MLPKVVLGIRVSPVQYAVDKVMTAAAFIRGCELHDYLCRLYSFGSVKLMKTAESDVGIEFEARMCNACNACQEEGILYAISEIIRKCIAKRQTTSYYVSLLPDGFEMPAFSDDTGTRSSDFRRILYAVSLTTRRQSRNAE